MHKGNQPRILLNSKGRMFALATGADHTSEHEWGSKPMLEALTGDSGPSAENVANRLRAEDPNWPARVQAPAGDADLAALVPEYIAGACCDLTGLSYHGYAGADAAELAGSFGAIIRVRAYWTPVDGIEEHDADEEAHAQAIA